MMRLLGDLLVLLLGLGLLFLVGLARHGRAGGDGAVGLRWSSSRSGAGGLQSSHQQHQQHQQHRPHWRPLLTRNLRHPTRYPPPRHQPRHQRHRLLQPQKTIPKRFSLTKL